MLQSIRDMPVGTIGFQAIGDVDDDDWERTVEPALRALIAAGHKVRLLYLVGPTAQDLEGDTMAAAGGFRARHATAFERVAIVSDEDWLRPAVRVLSVLLPGKTRAFPVREVAAAKAWVATDD